MHTKKIAVILSGCGHQDGSEIHEATLTLWAIHKHGADFQCFAPDIDQHHVLNHLTGEEMQHSRNVLIESARIARGAISPLSHFSASDCDALILPGGFGAAKNLSDFAFAGAGCQVHTEVEEALLTMRRAGKPIGALCIAPVILAKLFPGINLTIGQDPTTLAAIEELGAVHTTTGEGEVIVDRENMIVSTPCYMLDSRIDKIGEGAEQLVVEILKLVEKQ